MYPHARTVFLRRAKEEADKLQRFNLQDVPGVKGTQGIFAEIDHSRRVTSIGMR